MMMRLEILKGVLGVWFNYETLKDDFRLELHNSSSCCLPQWRGDNIKDLFLRNSDLKY